MCGRIKAKDFCRSWRGAAAALAEFDGKSWFNPLGQEQVVQVDDGQLVVRSATGRRCPRAESGLPSSLGSRLIFRHAFRAGTVETIKIDVTLSALFARRGFHVVPRFGIRGLNYSAYGFTAERVGSWISYTAQLPLGVLAGELLSLPETDRSGEFQNWRRQMTMGADTPHAQKARAIESHLRRDYGYTLELLSETGG